MPEIKPFNGVYPSPERVKDIAVFIENMTMEEAKAERDRNPLSYMHMLIPAIDKDSTENPKEQAFEKIKLSFDEFLAKNYLICNENPSFYIVEMFKNEVSQKGLLSLTSVKDYLSGKIKKHELIRPDREDHIADYLSKTGLDAIPVLLTYPDNASISALIEQCTLSEPVLSFNLEEYSIKLWTASNLKTIEEFVCLFSLLDEAYIADGHHRIAAAVDAGFNYFTAVFLPVSQLQIFSFHRLLKDLNGLETETFLSTVRRNFHIHQVVSFKDFDIPGSINMYLKGLCLTLMPKDHILNREGIVANLDVALIQDFIIVPLLNIQDLKNDSRLEFIGEGIKSVEEIMKEVDEGYFALAFIVKPLTADIIMKVADAGEVLPPKSTFVLPKFPAGLVVNRNTL